MAVITGATSGIGLRTAEVFVAEGAKIVIAGRRIPEGEALAKQLAMTGGRNWSPQQQGYVALRKAFDQGA